ncbi:MAG: hypothetical protein KDD70_02865 [Bdellovibrionales bacterium]|nr:hypothetical protein [Bdellovibrionales bacterium]
MTSGHFLKDDGSPVPCVSFQQLQQIFSTLQEDHFLSSAQFAEGPGYSFAMVVRFALGLSAEGGLVCAIVRDTIPGAIALSCLRHLVNGGAEAVVLVIEEDPSQEPTVIANALKTVQSYGVNVEHWTSSEQNPLVQGVLGQCHNVLFGTTSIKTPDFKTTNFKTPEPPSELMNGAVSLLNEMSTPVHCIVAPQGFDLASGEKNGEYLYASSTLSLGAPLEPLLQREDLLGRHYLADLSIPLSTYQKLLPDCPPPFSEQPVVALHKASAES